MERPNNQVYLKSDHSGEQTVRLTSIWWFNLKKLNEVEDKEQYRLEIANRFTTSGNFDAEVDVNKSLDNY
jgi:hypothetical protein